MTKYKIFVDGAVGTTGLRIHERLSTQTDIELLELPEHQRKDLTARLDKIAEADLTLLCLPDDAAKEIIALAPKESKICDTSTAHRTQSDWVYGFAELTSQTEKIAQANRVAVPGCHATGFISLVRPLIEKGALSADYPLICHSLTGYSGGGKAMIADYQQAERSADFDAPRMYGLNLNHKHLPEMMAVTGSSTAPIFTPVVADYYSGMLVTVPLPMTAIHAEYASGEKITQLLSAYYQGKKLVNVHQLNTMPTPMMAANQLSGKDNLEIFVYANSTQIVLMALFDNLGKGSSGAAVQCMNIMLGRDETAGLTI
ncbi:MULTISPECIES: N-acetyl-gamma-glutamyl-phosphate reductase [Glaesserella]|uniref:N-acetyl-gamma-glutamyl-phosphate reductase n=1 Tax=Glaesserella australis TaxID=2094024 RepID=A0A328C3G8_9PAST|nr:MULTISPECIES: N-acetyl-gamma-glutamyl-phosphate reductase [Glaesserella]AUI65649.1 N-acetyl-gamma-glutamyl-phosphate reductase [Glaesserella sp. 15-184]RAL19064.1 N-acetyl-gamma-glutamyl-phosphate reductase [Glaesserella australis]